MEVFRHKRKYVKKFNKQVKLVGTSSYVVSLVAKNLLTSSSLPIMEVFRHKWKYVERFIKHAKLVGTSPCILTLVAKNLPTFFQLADHGDLPPQTKVREEV